MLLGTPKPTARLMGVLSHPKIPLCASQETPDLCSMCRCLLAPAYLWRYLKFPAQLLGVPSPLHSTEVTQSPHMPLEGPKLDTQGAATGLSHLLCVCVHHVSLGEQMRPRGQIPTLPQAQSLSGSELISQAMKDFLLSPASFHFSQGKHLLMTSSFS